MLIYFSLFERIGFSSSSISSIGSISSLSKSCQEEDFSDWTIRYFIVYKKIYDNNIMIIIKLDYGEDDCRTVYLNITNDDIIFGVELLSNLVKLVDQTSSIVPKTEVTNHKFKEVIDLLGKCSEKNNFNFNNDKFLEEFKKLLAN